jgi:hypothetical protein
VLLNLRMVAGPVEDDQKYFLNGDIRVSVHGGECLWSL